jgi:DNA-binding response OmpR family regulator
MKILVVDDDRVLADVITFTLHKEGYDIIKAYDGVVALERWQEEQPDLVILDVNMPRMGGFEVCRRIRAESDTPIMMLTVRGDEEDILGGFELGADDYIVKPFSPRQLVARVKAILRRSGAKPQHLEIQAGEFTLYPGNREFLISPDQDPIKLTPLENQLMEYFMVNAGQVLTVEMIIDQVWGPMGGDRDMLRQLIRRLRIKIEPDPSDPVYIHTVPGMGYGLLNR